MNKTIVTLAAVLLASGAAFAGERSGDAAPAMNRVNAGTIATTTSEPLVRSGDAAPASIVVNAPQVGGLTSDAALVGTTSTHIAVSPRALYGSN
ncbi:hypothetical protein [Mesorhizobium sp. KR1-2]|uniref:hypothetical protein n=1 Tax=Mesorhizobium sp. KR1-2 TaxID=3156609 RepID=UPI0032B383B9